ncbi:MAG: hypothetical protein PHS32_03025 [Rhodoferax sp.]|uniref:hypothetical protein n=1 Tax=Rhodoferax sp. TaxID=50421 RepID=UPI00263302C4|nr:hypothetical protein [Rhodoferax sp.]MDD5332694.1 hypothetical protein [Rhodoferax sp.]
MKNTNIKWGAGVAAAISTALLVVACGGTVAPPVVANDVTAPVTSATVAALSTNATPMAFPTGVPEFGTTAPTTLVLSGTSATPDFSIASGGNTATGVTTFGSCHFTIRTSSFPAGSPLAVGQVIVIDPCNLVVNTSGAPASGSASTRSVTLRLGNIASTGSPVPVTINSNGVVQIYGVPVGTGTLTEVTGAR